MKKCILIALLASFLTPIFAQDQSDIDSQLSLVVLNTVYGPAESLQKIIGKTTELLHYRDVAMRTNDPKLIQEIDSNLRRNIPALLKQMDDYLISLQANNMVQFSRYLSPEDLIEIAKIRNTVSCAKEEYQKTLADLK